MSGMYDAQSPSQISMSQGRPVVMLSRMDDEGLSRMAIHIDTALSHVRARLAEAATSGGGKMVTYWFSQSLRWASFDRYVAPVVANFRDA
jgi:hypothetical protein